MKQFNGKKLAKDLKQKRFVELGLEIRPAAKEIGISAATLSRLENAHTPDINTMYAVCKWLKKPFDSFFSTTN